MKRYIISKYIKATGHVVEGRGRNKQTARTRFKRALKAFRRLRNSGLVEVDVFGHNGKVFVRKRLVISHLEALKNEGY